MWQLFIATVVPMATLAVFYGTSLTSQLQKEVEISRLEVQSYCNNNFLAQQDLDRQMGFRDQRLAMLHSKVQTLEKHVDTLRMQLKARSVTAPATSHSAGLH